MRQTKEVRPMDDFDFTRPAQSEVYNANVARLRAARCSLKIHRERACIL
jgi:hypothetical protein